MSLDFRGNQSTHRKPTQARGEEAKAPVRSRDLLRDNSARHRASRPPVCQENIPPQPEPLLQGRMDSCCLWQILTSPSHPRSSDIFPLFCCSVLVNPREFKVGCVQHSGMLVCISGLSLTIFYKPQRRLCGQSPADQQFLNSSDQPVWYQQPCCVQSHLNHLSSLFKVMLTLNTPGCTELLPCDSLTYLRAVRSLIMWLVSVLYICSLKKKKKKCW